MQIDTEIDVLKLVCQRLAEQNFSYMLTGSLATNLYVVPRMTRDIDLVIELKKPDVDRLICSFQEDCYLSEVAIDEALELEKSFNIIHHASGIKIDFMVRKNIQYRKVEFERRKKVMIDKVPIWVVAPEDLIISKLYWAKDSRSDLQLRDVKNLLKISSNLDQDYLTHWIDKLQLTDVYSGVKDG